MSTGTSPAAAPALSPLDSPSHTPLAEPIVQPVSLHERRSHRRVLTYGGGASTVPCVTAEAGPSRLAPAAATTTPAANNSFSHYPYGHSHHSSSGPSHQRSQSSYVEAGSFGSPRARSNTLGLSVTTVGSTQTPAGRRLRVHVRLHSSGDDVLSSSMPSLSSHHLGSGTMGGGGLSSGGATPQQLPLAPSRQHEPVVELELEDTTGAAEELAVYKAKKHAEMNILNRMNMVVIAALAATAIAFVAAETSSEWYAFAASEGSVRQRITFSPFAACLVGTCGTLRAAPLDTTLLFFRGVPAGELCTAAEDVMITRRNAVGALSILYAVFMAAALTLSVAVNRRPTRQRTQTVVAVCTAAAILFGIFTLIVFHAMYVWPFLYCGQGLCEVAAAAARGRASSGTNSSSTASSNIGSACSGDLGWGMWCFIGSILSAGLAMGVSAAIRMYIWHFRRVAAAEVANMRHHRLEAYLQRCLAEGRSVGRRERMTEEELVDIQIAKVLRHRLNIASPGSGVLEDEDGSGDDSANGGPPDVDLSQSVTISRAAWANPDTLRGRGAHVAIAGASDWLFDGNSQLYYSYAIDHFWDPTTREYYSVRTRAWVGSKPPLGSSPAATASAGASPATCTSPAFGDVMSPPAAVPTTPQAIIAIAGTGATLGMLVSPADVTSASFGPGPLQLSATAAAMHPPSSPPSPPSSPPSPPSSPSSPVIFEERNSDDDMAPAATTVVDHDNDVDDADDRTQGDGSLPRARAAATRAPSMSHAPY